MNRRDLLLQQMGMTQWKLRRPDTLKGAVYIQVAEHIRLIIISETPLSADVDFIQDVLRSYQIKPNDCLFIDFDQIYHLNLTQQVTYWLLSQNREKIDRTLPLCEQSSHLWQSPDLTTLKQDSKAKRQLWQQIQSTN
ncbi:DNA polymerase III subunit psi [Lonepinella sp. MS14435]|uniref:DNA polymerase III subunit psi n=1 Tax=Lonepinella sp. MS14435 TaxID=3003618 RepID=UPI0036DB43AF